MNSDLKYEKVNIELRRGKVLELLSKGYNQRSIAEKLNVSDALISLDIQWIREQSKEGLRTHLQEKLPYEFTRAMTGINDLLKRATDILDNIRDPKLQLQYMTLLTQLYGSIMSMATDGGVIEQAMKMVKGLESQGTDRVKMSSDKKGDEDVGEEDFEDEEITVENDEEIINEEEQELREE